MTLTDSPFSFFFLSFALFSWSHLYVANSPPKWKAPASSETTPQTSPHASRSPSVLPSAAALSRRHPKTACFFPRDPRVFGSTSPGLASWPPGPSWGWFSDNGPSLCRHESRLGCSELRHTSSRQPNDSSWDVFLPLAPPRPGVCLLYSGKSSHFFWPATLFIPVARLLREDSQWGSPCQWWSRSSSSVFSGLRSFCCQHPIHRRAGPGVVAPLGPPIRSSQDSCHKETWPFVRWRRSSLTFPSLLTVWPQPLSSKYKTRIVQTLHLSLGNSRSTIFICRKYFLLKITTYVFKIFLSLVHHRL